MVGQGAGLSPSSTPLKSPLIYVLNGNIREYSKSLPIPSLASGLYVPAVSIGTGRYPAILPWYLFSSPLLGSHPSYLRNHWGSLHKKLGHFADTSGQALCQISELSAGFPPSWVLFGFFRNKLP